MRDAEEKRANDVTSKIAAANAKLDQCMEANDVTCLSAEYDDNVVIMPQGSPVVVGKNAAISYLQWIEDVDTVTFTSLQVNPLNSAATYVFERFDIHATDKSSNVLMQGKGLRIWKKAGNDYKVYVSMFNSNEHPQCS